jgi:hypothetical protein
VAFVLAGRAHVSGMAYCFVAFTTALVLGMLWLGRVNQRDQAGHEKGPRSRWAED